MGFIGDWFAHTIEGLPLLLEGTKPTVFYESGGFRISSTVTTTWILMILIIAFVLFITSKLEKVPTTRRQAIAEKITMFIYNFVEGMCGKATPRIYGIIGGIFITILVMNFTGLVPGNTSPTASYSTTLALALFGFIYVQYKKIREQGFGGYLKSYVDPNAFMIIGNITGLVSTPLSLSMRLFGNMFSGKVLDSIVYLSVPILLPIVFLLLSLLSAVIQAYVFALLLTMFISEGLNENDI